MPLTSLQQPLLFVRGTRDAFSDAAEFEAARARLTSQRVEVWALLAAHMTVLKQSAHSVKAEVPETIATKSYHPLLLLFFTWKMEVCTEIQTQCAMCSL